MDDRLFHFLNVVEVLRGVSGVRHQKEAMKVTSYNHSITQA